MAEDRQMWKQHAEPEPEPTPNHGTIWLHNDDDDE